MCGPVNQEVRGERQALLRQEIRETFMEVRHLAPKGLWRWGPRWLSVDRHHFAVSP
jgi:hypothetical protein